MKWMATLQSAEYQIPKLTLTVSGKGTGSGAIQGTMAFDRKDYDMNAHIPFIRIADRVEVTVDLKGKRVSGPPLVFKQAGLYRLGTAPMEIKNMADEKGRTK